MNAHSYPESKTDAEPAQPAKSTELADALAAPRTVVVGGCEMTAHLLTFNDLIVIEEQIGDVAFLDLSKISHQRLVLHLSLHTQSEEEAGRLLTVKDVVGAKSVITEILRASGLYNDEEEGGAEETVPKKGAGRKAKPA